MSGTETGPGPVVREPRVAVVVRTKDRPGFLARALRDLAAQTYRDFEVVVVNDGGDVTAADAVVARHRGALPRVRLLHRVTSTGMEAASNYGLAHSASRYVTVHDDDDTWHPDFLLRTVGYLEGCPEAMGVSVRCEVVLEEAGDVGYREFGRHVLWPELTSISLADMLVINRMVPITFLYRRCVHERVGYYDESLPAVGDWEFYLRFLRRFPIDFLDGQPLAFWHQRPRDRGASANSMFAAAAEHRAYDRLVRDRYMHPDSPDPHLGTLLQVSGLYRQAEEHNRTLEHGLNVLLDRVGALHRELGRPNPGA